MVKRSQGFTLIELIVVVAVMMAVTLAVATGVNNIRGASAQAEAGKVATAVRYLYNLAVVTGRNQRMVIDLDTRTWWGEGQTSDDPCQGFLLPGDKEDEGTDEQMKKSGGFEASKTTLLQKNVLDKGVKFAGVLTSHDDQPLEKGQAFINFFPNGTTEHALIQLNADDDWNTVEVFALQGTAKVHSGKVEFDELKRDKEER
jgi:prepilin-type N-terminal cleavage/methylation domain-containing protein